MKYLILIAITLSTNAMAEQKIFYQSKGEVIKAERAILAAMRGDEVYKCQTVEAKVSKSGTSIGLRNVKKAKAE